MNDESPTLLKHHGPVVVRGTGSIGLRHLRVLKQLGIEAVAFPFRSAAAREELSDFTVIDSFDEIPGRGITKAIVATDTAQHLSDALRLVGAGCDVLVEKPLAATSHGIADLYAAAEANQRSVFTACCLRFHAGLQAFRQWLPRIGRVFHVRIECQSYLPDWRPGRDYRGSYSARADEGGVLRDLIHEIDYAIWLFGAPGTVYAQLHNDGVLGLDSEESADLLWKTESGASVSIHLDYITPKPVRVMRATGEHGILVWDAIRGAVEMRGRNESDSIEVNPHRDEMYRRQLCAFLESVSGKRSDCIATVDDGAFAVSLCDAARRSGQSGREEPIEDWRPVHVVARTV